MSKYDRDHVGELRPLGPKATYHPQTVDFGEQGWTAYYRPFCCILCERNSIPTLAIGEGETEELALADLQRHVEIRSAIRGKAI